MLALSTKSWELHSPVRLAYDSARAGYVVDSGSAPGSYALADPCFNVRSLNANMVARWEFRSGSTLFVVWTQTRNNDAVHPFSLPEDSGRLFAALPGDVFLVKSSWWLPP